MDSERPYIYDEGFLPIDPDQPLTPEEGAARIAAKRPPVKTPEGAPTWESTQDLQEVYGTPGQQAVTALEGAGEGLIGFGVVPAVERMFGVQPKDIRLRQEANPILHGAFNVAGFIAPLGAGKIAKTAQALNMAELATAIPKAAKYTQLGVIDKIGKTLVPFTGESLAAKMGVNGARLAIENAVFQGGDEVAKMIKEDPNQSAETAISNILLSSAIGGALGVGGTAAKAAFDKTAGKLFAQIKNKLNFHYNNPNPVEGMHKELVEHTKVLDDFHDEVYGFNGTRQQGIEKLVPAMNETITAEVNRIRQLANETLEKLGGRENPYGRVFAESVDRLEAALGVESKETTAAERMYLQPGGTAATPKTSAEVFEAINNFKKEVAAHGQWSRNGIQVSVNELPVLERPFVAAMRQTTNAVRTALENEAVWGKAGELQKNLNAAFKDFLTARNDMRRSFMKKVMGEYVFNPAAIGTYLEQLGSSKALIKQDIVANYIAAAEKYSNAVDDIYSKIGVESPIKPVALNITENSLKKVTPGDKLVNAFMKWTSPESGTAGTAAAAGVGAKGAEMLGASQSIGAMLGVGVLGPMFKTVLPALARAIFQTEASGPGAKAAFDYVNAVYKGNAMITSGIKNIFRPEAHVLPAYAMPTESDRKKLQNRVEEMTIMPEVSMDKKDALGHYLPEQSMAMTSTAANAVRYLNSLRPDTDRRNPLDSKPVASDVEKSKYQSALDLANQPAYILTKVKNGTINSVDMQHMKAMYPSLLANMQMKLLDEMITSISKGNVVPYKTRIGLSVFLEKPLDSTMTPAAFMSTQKVMSPKSVQRQEQSLMTSQQLGAKGRPSAPALQKMPNMYQTFEQSKLLHRNKR